VAGFYLEGRPFGLVLQTSSKVDNKLKIIKIGVGNENASASAVPVAEPCRLPH